MKKTFNRIVMIMLVMSLTCVNVILKSMSVETAEIGKEWISSGIYQYQIVDAKNKYVAIRRINSTSSTIVIPETIDGYTVKYVGIPDTNDIREEVDTMRVMGDNELTLKQLKIPDTVCRVGIWAFGECKNLEKVEFPKNDMMEIRESAFYGCNKLVNITLYSADVKNDAFGGDQPIERLELNKVATDDEYGGSFGGRKVEKLILKNCQWGYLKSINWLAIEKMYVSASEDEFSLSAFSKQMIEKLYINGSVTKIKGGTTDQVERLYTIPNAKAISWAKKRHVPYDVKSTGKMGKVTKKKKGKGYQYSWKAVKTTVRSYRYKGKKKGWKTTKKSAATQYKVYGKKKKGDSYKLIKTTKKRKITTPYQYVKVKVVKTWLE